MDEADSHMDAHMNEPPPSLEASVFPLKAVGFLPLYESFMRGEEDEEDEEEGEGAEEVRVMEAWVAARPSRNRELQVIIMAIIIMVIILANLEQTPFFNGRL